MATTEATLFRRDLPRPSFPLFDCHVHLGASDTGQLYYPHLSGDEYLGLMEAANVEAACAFPPQREDGYAAANRRLARWAEEQPERNVRVFARLGGRHLPAGRLRNFQLWRWRRKASFLVRGRPPDLDAPEDLQHFDGVKLLPHLDGLPAESVFARIRELGLPVLIHAGTHSTPTWIARRVLPRVPGPLILAHLGAFPAAAGLLEDAVTLAKQHEKVYLDTSGAWISNFIRYAARRVPQKLLFGSDAPLAHPLVAWQHVASVVQDDGLLRRIGRGAAHKLFD